MLTVGKMNPVPNLVQTRPRWASVQLREI